MKIGVDATTWQNKRGYGRFARALLDALVRVDQNNCYTFFVDTNDGADQIPESVDVRLVRTTKATVEAASSEGARSISDMIRMSKAMADSELEVLLFPTIYSYVPVFSRAKKIVMIYDVIAEKYPDLTLPTWKGRLFWKLKVGIGSRQASALGTISEYSRDGIAGHFHIPRENIYVVKGASDPVFQVLENPQIPEEIQRLGIFDFEKIILYVGGFGPHKNLHMLIDGCAKLLGQNKIKNTCLVMVGEYQREAFHSSYHALKQQIDESGLSEYTFFTGYLPDEELVGLLNKSTVLVLPSIIEGLGLPALEAAACGCPVIATKESPLPDLLGEAGLYFDPWKQVQLEDAIERVLNSENLRVKMHAAGINAARKLSWEKSGLQMKNIIEEVVSR
jgi:glycosyltransferase involved in cell wall biosynthesis